MKISKKVFYGITCLILLTACQPKPNIINYPTPNMSHSFSVFDGAGCPSDEYGLRTCNVDSPLAALGCNIISEPPDFSGGLIPSYPLATCEVRADLKHPSAVDSEIISGEYFYDAGGIVPFYIRYIIFKDNQFELIKTEKELRKVFAPIETPEEALSYVLVAKNLSAYYGLTRNPQYEYEVDRLEDTHVDKLSDGYLLHLYYYEVFGCGPHWTYAVEIHLSVDGIIQEVSRKPVFKDPAEDNLCTD